MSDSPFVSVIIAALNEEQYIGRCLESLARQRYPHDCFEVIVADGGSTDRTREVVQGFITREHLQLSLIANPRRGTAAGRNFAIAQARGEIIVPLDAHAAAAPDFLRAAVAALQRSNADCVGGPLINSGYGIVGSAIALALSSPFGVGNAAFRYSQREQWTDTVAFGAYRREVFDRIGVYDEAMDRGEDDEFNYRLLDAGGRILLTPAMRTIYYTRTSFGGLWRQYFGYGRAKVEVLRRHPQRWRVRHFVPALFVSSLLATGTPGVLWHPLRKLFAGILGAYGLASLLATASIVYQSNLLVPSPPGAEGSDLSFHDMRECKLSSCSPIEEGVRRGGQNPLSLLLLPIAFAIMHMGYGLGFLISLIGGRR